MHVTHAVLGPHAAELAASSPVASAGAFAPVLSAAPGSDVTVPSQDDTALEAAEEPDATASAEAEKKAAKATVSLRLVGFEAAKKISVIKEVRAMLGEGITELNELVERSNKYIYIYI